MSVKDDLIAARALIDTPEKWCQRTPGMMRNGQRAFCTYIAIAEAAEAGTRIEARTALAAALPWWWRLRMLGRGVDQSLIWFNDRRATKHNHVMRAFDRAIAAQP